MIVKDIATVKAYVPSVETARFEKLQPHIISANEVLRTQILGAALYSLIEPETDPDNILLVLCQRFVCFKAYERAIPFLDLKQTEQGFAVVDTQGLVPASKERVRALVLATQLESDAAEDSLLAWLEVAPMLPYKTAWLNTQCCTYLTDTYFFTLEVFARFSEYNEATKGMYPQRRRDFAALRGSMRYIIRSKIVSLISRELHKQLIDELSNDTLSDANVDLIELLRFSLASYTLGQNEKGSEYLRMAGAMLKADPDDYPVWRDSAIGQAELNRVEPTNDGSIFFML